jgi:oligopeptide transport system substrate-binding protein
MLIRGAILGGALAAALLIASCEDAHTGPVDVSAIGGAPKLLNPNLHPLDPPSAFLLEAAAQGLVRFDAAGQIEPALAQTWIVSDDGLRYTFRLARREWTNGGRVAAEQVVVRLRASASPASRNPLKPLLGAIAEIEAMTDDVLEITLKAPRPTFLHLLAQPEMAILRNGHGTGPYRPEPEGTAVRLSLAGEDGDDADADNPTFPIVLRGERAGLAVARFASGAADLVTGGTAGDLPVARAADPPAAALVFDPVAGLFGLAFTSDREPLDDVEVRRALTMAIDRAALVGALGVPGLQPRETLVPLGVRELPAPRVPGWAANPMPARIAAAARTISAAADGEPLSLRVSIPDGPGYRLVFAFLRRDWRRIGVDAQAVPAGRPADLRLIDAVAPADLATWYLRHFTCAASPICDEEADTVIESARNALTAMERRTHIASADRLLTELAAFVPLTAPVRWSLVGPRITGFRPNPFGIHAAGELLAREP